MGGVIQRGPSVLLTATPLGCLDMWTLLQSSLLPVVASLTATETANSKEPRLEKRTARSKPLLLFVYHLCVLLCHSISERAEERDTHLAVGHTDLSIITAV